MAVKSCAGELSRCNSTRKTRQKTNKTPKSQPLGVWDRKITSLKKRRRKSKCQFYLGAREMAQQLKSTCLLFQRTQAQTLTPTKWLTPVYNSNPRDSNVFSGLQEHRTDIHAGKTMYIRIKKKCSRQLFIKPVLSQYTSNK